jgi:hypothetical protein
MGTERKRVIMSQDNRVYFIEPIGGDTNARLFRDILVGRDEDVCEQHECVDGSKLNLLRVSDVELAMCIVNRRTSGLTFNAFRQTEKGIERIYIVFKDDIEDALEGRIPFDQAKISYEGIAGMLSGMPIIQPPKKVPSTYGVAPFNAKKKKLPIRISER